MITLHLGIGIGDIMQYEASNLIHLLQILNPLEDMDCVWLATADGERGELIVTENFSALIAAVREGTFAVNGQIPKNLFLQEYKTYEDAYAVALDMREGNPKCYCEEPPFSSLN